jgi:hypothetical protein
LALALFPLESGSIRNAARTIASGNTHGFAMTDFQTFICPLVEGRVYTIGELRQTEAVLLAERQSDQKYSAKLRTQKDKSLNWAKSRNEEAL